VRPFTPTAFASEKPPKWGFFFWLNGKCAEYKGTSLDVYSVIESVWHYGRMVVLEFDKDDLIIKATPVDPLPTPAER
jgi:hypothetical protein